MRARACTHQHTNIWHQQPRLQASRGGAWHLQGGGTALRAADMHSIEQARGGKQEHASRATSASKIEQSSGKGHCAASTRGSHRTLNSSTRHMRHQRAAGEVGAHQIHGADLACAREEMTGPSRPWAIYTYRNEYKFTRDFDENRRHLTPPQPPGSVWFAACAANKKCLHGK